MSLEMAHKVILPPKKNYIPQFLKQRDINSYYIRIANTLQFCFKPRTPLDSVTPLEELFISSKTFYLFKGQKSEQKI